MDNPDFVLVFDRKRKWVNVYLWDVHPSTFANWNAGRWGYFEPARKAGHFGDLHFVKNRLRIDTICHELDHLREEWIWSNRLSWNKYSEERFVEFKDRLLWQFLRELSKVEPKAKIWMKSLSLL